MEILINNKLHICDKCKTKHRFSIHAWGCCKDLKPHIRFKKTQKNKPIIKENNMYICIKCKKEMKCDKNGVGADYGNGHVYAADRFKCMTCGYMILATNRNAYQDPKYKIQDEYLHMPLNK